MAALLNAQVPNLATTGRCISADFAAQASLRLSPHAGALGHAAGAAAALAFRGRRPGALPEFRQLDWGELRSLLRLQGAFLNEENGR